MTYSKDVYELNKEVLSVSAVSPSKYHNARTEANGMTFQSGHEAAGVGNLILLEAQHEIFALRLQVRFPLSEKITYVADAVYLDNALQSHIVDFKGYATPEFKLKKKLFKSVYGQEIEEL